MVRPRKIDIKADKDTLLELHCLINYESESPWVRSIPFEQYREWWLSTSQPESFLEDLTESMADERNIAEIWEEGRAVIGYLWVTFSYTQASNLTIGEVRDIAVATDYRRRGVGRKMMAHAEQLAHDRGAHLLRSETGIENTASQKLHASFAYKPYRIQYEKLLADEKLIRELIEGKVKRRRATTSRGA